MAVYVDAPKHQYGRMIMCHMLADTIEELHEMADKIGIKRKWFQNHSTPHYDICKSKREQAVKYGAVEVGYRKIAELIKKYKANKPTITGFDLASGPDESVEMKWPIT